MVRILAVMFVLALGARAETTLVIEAAPSDEGPWVVVPIGPEALDLRGAIVWEGLPAEWRFVRVRVVTREPAVRAVDCFCDGCQGVALEEGLVPVGLAEAVAAEAGGDPGEAADEGPGGGGG